ncbi:hypothetical protein C8R43DRAFT_1162012 [Mycena crocata]|nr:hypothetical protein C8R43DRAFT_1162012 [Mycena crocata]
MACPSFTFTRSRLILLVFLTLQLFVSGTQAHHCDVDDDDDFDCDYRNEDPAAQRRDRIIGASVAGGCLLLIGIAYLIYVLRKRRIRATQVPAYPFTGIPANTGPPQKPGQMQPHYEYGYGQGPEAMYKHNP